MLLSLFLHQLNRKCIWITWMGDRNITEIKNLFLLLMKMMTSIIHFENILFLEIRSGSEFSAHHKMPNSRTFQFSIYAKMFIHIVIIKRINRKRSYSDTFRVGSRGTSEWWGVLRWRFDSTCMLVRLHKIIYEITKYLQKLTNWNWDFHLMKFLNKSLLHQPCHHTIRHRVRGKCFE